MKTNDETASIKLHKQQIEKQNEKPHWQCLN